MPWGHVTVLLDKLDKLGDQRERDWYAAAAVEYGWSRNVLLNQIMSQLQPRAGTAPSNFTAQLPAADSELAQQLTRDPYVLDFLDLTGPVAERDLEKALVDRLHDFLLEGWCEPADHPLGGQRRHGVVRHVVVEPPDPVRAQPGERVRGTLRSPGPRRRAELGEEVGQQGLDLHPRRAARSRRGQASQRQQHEQRLVRRAPPVALVLAKRPQPGEQLGQAWVFAGHGGQRDSSGPEGAG
ncbi:MAG TPA: PDDEXK nuclease domain-containing protein [Kineosporiaceae bacterium]|nr:PDDEXK nuclease domain-containing protein [Kineosporiaceae bacterium]